MKNLNLSLLVILYIIGIEKPVAQNFTVSPVVGTKTELIAHIDNSFYMPYCQGNWSKESILQIETLIRKYGNPDEITQSRMLWKLPGDIPKVIIFTEYFLYFPDSISKKAKACYTSNQVWN